MKGLTITFCADTAFTVAMGRQPASEKAAENRKATAEQFDKFDRQTTAAAQQMQDYAFSQEAEFVAKSQGRKGVSSGSDLGHRPNG